MEYNFETKENDIKRQIDFFNKNYNTIEWERVKYQFKFFKIVDSEIENFKHMVAKENAEIILWNGERKFYLPIPRDIEFPVSYAPTMNSRVAKINDWEELRMKVLFLPMYHSIWKTIFKNWHTLVIFQRGIDLQDIINKQRYVYLTEEASRIERIQYALEQRKEFDNEIDSLREYRG